MDNPYRPPQVEVQITPSGRESTKQEPLYDTIGGWLLLPMLGMVFTPFAIAFNLWTNYVPIFTGGQWQEFTTPGSELYHPLLGPLLIFELIANLGVGVLVIVCLFCLFPRKRIFPRLAIAYYLVSIAFVVLDHIGANQIPLLAANPETGDVQEIVRAVAAGGIWIPYMLLSRRVKGTFVN